ncbi:uncharacterized protein LOC132625797 [Lycium barbarum]|uniref:uncharacterized protein LOC132625797 n=1 Tax=Lycium barbarum TaxID=112863 RepID=UPI00293E6653|nr:uncharacterized protein LOC132625797 [Lycium barbarum]
MVKMISWNVRDLNGLNKQKEVKILCNKQEAGLVGLLETRIKVNNVNNIVDSMFAGWKYYSNHTSHYNGRILVTWRLDWVKYTPMQLEYLVTFVYAFNVKEDRKYLWDHLSQISGGMNSGNAITLADMIDFQKWVDTCRLENMKNDGCKYTWNDKQDSRIFSKIDRVLVNGEWVDSMPDINAHVLPEGISDHCSMTVQLVQTPMNKKKAFKHCNVWSTHPEFEKIIQDAWNEQIDGYLMYQVVRKMKLLKQKLKVLHKSNFCNLVEKANQDREDLKKVQTQLQQDPQNTASQKEEKEDEQCQWKYEQQQVEEVFVKFYKQLLGDEGGIRRHSDARIYGQGPKLSVEQQCDLVQGFTRKEIKQAMMSININKSPGPDGYGGGFYRAAWKVIGDDVCNAISECFSNGKLLKQLNATMISIILKVENPVSPSQYRLISCCNVFYKCISKLLCSRLNKILPTIVSPTQAAFVKGRSLVKNVLVCHDLLRHYNRKTTTRCMVKIDLKKAYDMVQWDFVKEMLEGFGFPHKFVQLIMECVTTTWFSVKVNGEGCGFFQDDLMISCKGNEASVTRVMEAIQCFSSTTCFIANNEKSSMFIAGVDDHIKEDLLRMNGFTSVFILPQSVLKLVNKQCREFVWGTNEGTKKISLVSWHDLCCSKKEGGLNIKNYRIWNIAVVGKLIWLYMNSKEQLWFRWVHGVYMKGEDDFWNHVPPQDCSWYWKQLHKIKQGMRNWYLNGRYCLTRTGKYSMTKGYIELIGDRPKLDEADLIWSKVLVPKHRILLWLAQKQRLLTRARLIKLGIDCEDDLCVLCGIYCTFVCGLWMDQRGMTWYSKLDGDHNISGKCSYDSAEDKAKALEQVQEGSSDCWAWGCPLPDMAGQEWDGIQRTKCEYKFCNPTDKDYN